MILNRASAPKSARRPSARTVESALLQLEKEQKRNKSKTDVKNLVGQWQLTLTSSEATPKARKAKFKNPFFAPQYFPVLARQSFIAATPDGCTGVFDNTVYALGCALNLRGPYRWIAKTNRLEFTAESAGFRVGPLPPIVFKNLDKPLDETRTAKDLPFFTFYIARSGIAAARGRSGGIALYAGVPKGQEKWFDAEASPKSVV
jgi:hypothetical protein